MTWNATELSHSTFTTLTWSNATTLSAKTKCAFTCLALFQREPTEHLRYLSIYLYACQSIRPAVLFLVSLSVCLSSGRPSIRSSVRSSVPQSVTPETSSTSRHNIPDQWILSVQPTMHPIESPSDDHIAARTDRADVRLCYGSSNTYYACEIWLNLKLCYLKKNPCSGLSVNSHMIFGCDLI